MLVNSKPVFASHLECRIWTPSHLRCACHGSSTSWVCLDCRIHILSVCQSLVSLHCSWLCRISPLFCLCNYCGRSTKYLEFFLKRKFSNQLYRFLLRFKSGFYPFGPFNILSRFNFLKTTSSPLTWTVHLGWKASECHKLGIEFYWKVLFLLSKACGQALAG